MTKPQIVPSTGGTRLASAVADHLGVRVTCSTTEKFPDGELRPRVGQVRGGDVYLIAPTGPPVNERLVELLLLLDACRRAGADRVTAVIPYFGYARQDRRDATGEALGARTVLDALAAAGAQRLVVVDPHTPALEAMSTVAVETLTARPILAEALVGLPEHTVVVAPDLGAVKPAERIAERLGHPVAVVRKIRVSGSSVRALELVGDVQDRTALILDDMISTGATVEAAARLLTSKGARPEITVAATHGPLVAGTTARLRSAGVRRLLITDSTPPADDLPPWTEVHSISALLADAIHLLHRARLDC